MLLAAEVRRRAVLVAACDLESNDRAVPLRGEQVLDLQRLLQEALANVIRHARASCIYVAVGRVGEQVCISVRDNEGGFDPAFEQVNASRGLQNLRTRAPRLRAEMQIETRPGGGSSVALRW